AMTGAPSMGGDSGSGGSGGGSGPGGGSGKDAESSQQGAIDELIKALVEAIGKKGKDDQKSGNDKSGATPDQPGGQGSQPNPNSVHPRRPWQGNLAPQGANAQGQPGKPPIRHRDLGGSMRTQLATTPKSNPNEGSEMRHRRTDLSMLPPSSSANTSKATHTGTEHVHSSGRDSNQATSHTIKTHSPRWGGHSSRRQQILVSRQPPRKRTIRL